MHRAHFPTGSAGVAHRSVLTVIAVLHLLGGCGGTTPAPTTGPTAPATSAETATPLGATRLADGRVSGAEPTPPSEEAIRSAMRTITPAVRACYERGIRGRNPAPRGRVVVRFSIHGDGHVSGATVDRSELADAAVEACIAEAVGTARFEPTGGGLSVVRYPFDLRPIDADGDGLD